MAVKRLWYVVVEDANVYVIFWRREHPFESGVSSVDITAVNHV